jgi:hypothetical protein
MKPTKQTTGQAIMSSSWDDDSAFTLFKIIPPHFQPFHTKITLSFEILQGNYFI